MGPLRSRRRRLAATSALALTAALWGAAACGQTASDRQVLPIAAPPFNGRIDNSAATSTPDWPKPVEAPKGAPNVLLIMTDDVGFGASSTFGGMIPTPNFDRLAAQGLKYNRFHVTAMCSPTRAALLTGHSPHSVGSGSIEEMSSGFPGYWGRIPPSTATIGEILKDNGYDTAFFGKHHNTPADQQSAAGPFDLWPTHLGFEYFYGFIGGATDQYHPQLFEGTTPVDLSKAPTDYILDRDLADHAIGWLHDQKAAAPDKPFFIYYAPGATHSPQQAPPQWIAKFRGKFDQGWDVLREQIYARQKQQGVIPADAGLTPRPPEIPAWDSLSPDQKRINARFMEVYAAQLAYDDDQVGRVIDEVGRMGLRDNTLVIFIQGDNGASMEGTPQGRLQEGAEMFNGVKETPQDYLAALDQMGGPHSEELYPAGWAYAMNTPFKWAKEVASHLGGTRDGMVISWPARIHDDGQLRSQYGYVSDILPTILEAANIPPPVTLNGVKQQPLEGASLVYTFDSPDAPSRHNTQYYEIMGNRGVYQNGWLANTTPGQPPWMGDYPHPPVLNYRWELYDLDHDFSQSRDLAAQDPAKLSQMQALFDTEARAHNVYPLDNSVQERSTASAGRLKSAAPVELIFWGGRTSIAPQEAPKLFARSFSITAQIETPDDKTTGVILATGGEFGGWSFYLKDGRPVAYEAYSDKASDQFKIASATPLPAGPATVRFDFDYDGGGLSKGGVMRISVGGQEVARGRIDRTIISGVPFAETFDVGRDTGSPVSEDYAGAGSFPGHIDKIVVDLGAQTMPVQVLSSVHPNSGD